MKLFGSRTKKTTFSATPSAAPSAAGSTEDSLVELQGTVAEELAPGLCNLYSPQVNETAHVRDIADVLLESNKLTTAQFDQIRQEEQKKGGCDIEKHLRSIGVSSEDLLQAKASLYGFEFRKITPEQIDRTAFGKLPLDYIKTNHVMPIALNENTLVVATSRPANVFAFDDIKRQTNLQISVIVCTDADIEAVANKLDDSRLDYDEDEMMNDLDEVEVVQDIEEDLGDLEKTAGESPVIKYVNFLLTNALREGASDIHIEPKEKYTKIRYRIDGMLFDMRQTSNKMHPAIVSRLKIMSNLDISERRVPQDGKIAVRMGGRPIDLRVSVLPTSHGEKVVVRLLDSSSILRGLDQSGMEPNVIQQFREQIALPHGILLVTGPTGSGKSTTLYSALGELKSDQSNISTVEDPVEYELEFCNQVHVNDKVGLTFSAALRSLLRQDPDIIMIGEIRDAETARIAVQAALTGHLVLSTLHTNDAPSSVSRLVNIGIEPYLIAASLNGILAQRLVRRICSKCKEPYKIPDNMMKYAEEAGIRPDEMMHGRGCDACRGSGFAGRAGIFELLIIDDHFRDIINLDSSVNSMRKAFHQSGQDSLFQDGVKKVKHGVTTLEEILRVTEAGHSEAADKPETEVAAPTTVALSVAESKSKRKAEPPRRKPPVRKSSSESDSAAKSSPQAASAKSKNLMLQLGQEGVSGPDATK
ncbi:MAG: type II/IV secretion system protein [Phycisphaerae bacterium]|nr:type II/IV secretion system protein [Phycisphaerae bacterium]